MRQYVVDKVAVGEVKINCTAYGCKNELSRPAIQSLISHDESAVAVWKGLCDIADKPVELIAPVRGLVEFFGSLNIPRVPRVVDGVTAPLADQSKLINQCVATPTDFYHYDCCGESDRGWGCAYRDLQMIVSNFILRGLSVKIPSILEIQQTLVDAAFVPATFLSSHSWIEPSHAQEWLKRFGFQSRYTIYDFKLIHRVPSIGDELEGDLWAHFRRDDYRTPVMFDDGIMAYVINGIATRVNVDGSKTTMVLRFDPHAKVMKTQRLEHFRDGSGVGVEWMEIDRAFGRGKRWMLLFPLQPQQPSSTTTTTPTTTATTPMVLS